MLPVAHIGAFKQHKDAVTELVVHPHQMLLMSSCKDGSVIIWEPKESSGQEYSEWGIRQEWSISKDPLCEGHCGAVTDLGIVKSGAKVVSSSLDNSVNLWDLTTGRVLRKIRNVHDRGINSVSPSLNGNIVVTGSSDASIKVFDLRMNTAAVKYADVFDGAHPGPVERVRMNPVYDSNYFFSCGATLKKWDMRARAASRRSEDLNWEWDSLFDFNPCPDLHLLEYGYDGVKLVCGGKSTVNIWDLREAGDCTEAAWDLKAPVRKWTKSFAPATRLSCVKFSPDMRYLAVGQGIAVYIWNLEFQSFVARIRVEGEKNGQRVAVTSLAWSLDVRYLFVGSNDGAVAVFKCFV